MYYIINPNILPKICLFNTATINPPYVHRKRIADEYIMYIIKNGELLLKENEIEYHLIPGDVILLDPDHCHEGVKASCCEYYYIHFRHEDIKKVCMAQKENKKDIWTSTRNHALQSNSFSYEIYDKELLMLPKYVHFFNQSRFTGLMYLLNDAMEENKTQLENYKIKCSCKVLEAFILIERNYVSSRMETSHHGRSKAYSKVQEILNCINVDYATNYSSHYIEEVFQCNFDYMNRVFKQTTGSTIFSYLNQVRIDHAKVLLLTTSLTITEIGEQVGFLDIYYFSKVFKKHTGVSPTKFSNGILKTKETD